KSGNVILLQNRQTIAISAKTKFRRYSPDSVKLADAKASKLDEVNTGDQIRARGEKSADGLKVDAEEVLFGSFLTKAGSVVSIDPASKEITAKELGNGKPLVIKLTADSTIKQMQGTPAPGTNTAQIIDKLPVAKFEDIKAGMSI